MTFWDYDRDAEITCPDCGWSGPGGGREEMFRDLVEVSCPQCGTSLLVVAFPTIEETREAAAAGNERAIAELPMVDVIESRWARAEELKLNEPSQLPDLPGAEIRIDWDFEDRKGDLWTVLRHDGTEIGRELAFYEGYERFAEVFEILRQRYGTRLREVRPTTASELYLYGDSLGSPQIIKDLNASLRPD